MTPKPLEVIEEHFGQVKDPRKDRDETAHAVDILVNRHMCHNMWSRRLGGHRSIWQQQVNLAKDIFGASAWNSSHDTFGRVFSMIDAQQFQLAFYEWVLAVNEIIRGQIINIDGNVCEARMIRNLGSERFTW